MSREKLAACLQVHRNTVVKWEQGDSLPKDRTRVEELAQARDRRRYPAPGQLLDVGGHRLHLLCSGKGSPPVILDAGLSCSLLDWSRVQPEVATFTQVCSHDRAGYGWSDPGPKPRS